MGQEITINKAKQQYRKLTESERPRKNFRWEPMQELLLQFVVEFYSNQWTFLVAHYFPYLTPEQLRLKYYQIQRRTRAFRQLLNLPQIIKRMAQLERPVAQLIIKSHTSSSLITTVQKINLLVTKIKQLDQYSNSKGSDSVAQTMDPLEVNVLRFYDRSQLQQIVDAIQILINIYEECATQSSYQDNHSLIEKLKCQLMSSE